MGTYHGVTGEVWKATSRPTNWNTHRLGTCRQVWKLEPVPGRALPPEGDELTAHPQPHNGAAALHRIHV